MFAIRAIAPFGRHPPRRFKVNLTPALHDPAALNPAERGTRRPKRIHDVTCIGALIFPEDGARLRQSDSVGIHRPGVAKKLRPTLPLEPALWNWSDHPGDLSYLRKERELGLLNLHWFDHHNGTLERDRSVRVDETRNVFRVIPEWESMQEKLSNWSHHPRCLSVSQRKRELRCVNSPWSDYYLSTSVDESRNVVCHQAHECTEEVIEEGVEVETDDSQSIETGESQCFQSSESQSIETCESPMNSARISSFLFYVFLFSFLSILASAAVPSAARMGSSFFSDDPAWPSPLSSATAGEVAIGVVAPSSAGRDSHPFFLTGESQSIETSESRSIVGDSEDHNEEDVIFEAAGQPLVDEVNSVRKFEKELECTLDGQYWAIAEGGRSRRRRRQTVFFGSY